MKQNPVKDKLSRGEPTFGTWLTMGDLYGTRVLARMGYDWLTLDLEHSAIDWAHAASLFGAIADAGCVPLARVPEGSHHYIKRVLDMNNWNKAQTARDLDIDARTVFRYIEKLREE